MSALRCIYIRRWLKVNQVFNILICILCILLVSFLQEIRLIRHRPCWRSEVGGEQGFQILLFQPWLLKKRSYLTVLDLSPNDEETLSSAEHWPKKNTFKSEMNPTQQQSIDD